MDKPHTQEVQALRTTACRRPGKRHEQLLQRTVARGTVRGSALLHRLLHHGISHAAHTWPVHRCAQPCALHAGAGIRAHDNTVGTERRRDGRQLLDYIPNQRGGAWRGAGDSGHDSGA